MASLELSFLSRNKHKLAEARDILAPLGIAIIPVHTPINELQTQDPQVLIRHKLLEAFRSVGRPVFVEHTGLYMSHFGDLPGGLTQIFWDSLQADRFAALFAHTAEAVTIARTYIGYTDSKSIKIFHGEVKGRITTPPVGPREFQWDCVFVPEGYSETFAEMGARKHDVSMRRRALDSLAAHLSKTK